MNCQFYSFSRGVGNLVQSICISISFPRTEVRLTSLWFPGLSFLSAFSQSLGASPWLTLPFKDDEKWPCGICQLFQYSQIYPIRYRITEWGLFEGTTVGHLLQPPCSRRVIPEHRTGMTIEEALLAVLDSGQCQVGSLTGTAQTVLSNPNTGVLRAQGGQKPPIEQGLILTFSTNTPWEQRLTILLILWVLSSHPGDGEWRTAGMSLHISSSGT